MKLKEYAKQYGVSEELLQQFLEAGILEEPKATESGEKEDVLKKLNSCTCLYSLGLSVSDIQTYTQLERSEEDTTKTRCKILRKARKKLLKNMHAEKDALDCIDCIMKELKADQCVK